MRYLGGKSRDAKRLAAVIDEARQPGQYVWDPFCGGLSMAAALSVKGPVVASDAHAALISLYKAVAAGWDLPTAVSEAEYAAAKALPDSDPFKAFCGFGCSYGGKWFGGYATPKIYARTATTHGGSSDYAAATRNALLRDVPKIEQFECLDFLAIEPHETGAVLYLDPPYRGTTRYSMAFNHDLFDARVRTWAAQNVVFVSEYALPYGECVLEVKTSSEKRLRQGAVERLYRIDNA